MYSSIYIRPDVYDYAQYERLTISLGHRKTKHVRYNEAFEKLNINLSYYSCSVLMQRNALKRIKSFRTFAPLHQVCTGISGKVQKNMPAIPGRILELEVDIEIYVQIRIVICTIYTRNGEPPRGGATRARVPVKSALVQTSRRYPKTAGGSGKWVQYGVIRGAN